MGTILIIEDDDTVRENITEILELNGFTTFSAPDGKQGFDLAINLQPDLIVCDMMMPEMDGMQVLAALRDHHDLMHTPFIFLTARVEKRDFRSAMNVGADDYLTKPFDLKDLLDTVKTNLRRKQKLERYISAKEDEVRKKIDLVSNHEINTPVFGILGASQMLFEDYFELQEKERLELAQAIYRSALRLDATLKQDALYGKLLYLLDHEEDCNHFTTGDTDQISALVSDCAKKLLILNRREGDISINVEDHSILMSFENLKTVISELLSNAFKFSEKGSIVEVLGKKDGKYYSLSIKDQGIGMDPSSVKKIYPFRQHHKDKMEQQGRGLGLFITDTIIRLHAGSIMFHTAPFKGTTVELQLPIFRSDSFFD